MLLPGAPKRFPYVFAATAAAIVLIGAWTSYFVYREVDSTGRAHILDRAAMLAALIPAEGIPQLSGNSSDLGTPAYELLKRELTEARAANEDIRFLYLMGERGGDMFFYADSEGPASGDYSPPGQVYDEATPAMRAVFSNGVPQVEGPDRDRWGTWISAYAPVTDAKGSVIALVGIDLPAQTFLRDLYVYTLLPALVALSLLLFVIAAELSRRRERRATEEKEEFLSVASHEIRTPLTGVRWGLEQLSREGGSLSEKNRSLVSLMHQTSVTLVARLNTLLDMHSIEHRKEREFTKDTIYLEAFLREAASTLMLAARERGVSVNLPQVGDQSMKGDSQLLRHVFQNLIGNAIKYTKPGTTVTVSYAKEGRYHVFHFSDEGDGIPPEEADMIFSGYRRGRSAKGTIGTGLGLYMARKAVLMHGGAISFESKPGSGTTFTVKIPE